MPPPCICLYQPRLLLPYDEYRGPIASVALICSGVCIEATCFFFCFLWALVCMHRGASKLQWALTPLPLQLFDFFVFSFGLWRVSRSSSWLLPSEKRLRAILLSGFFFRFSLCCLLSLHTLEKVPLVCLLAVAAAGYATGTILNITRRDAYTWVRLQCWDLVVLLQLLTISLSSVIDSSTLPLPLPIIRTSSAYIWPLWVLAAFHLCCCMLLGLLLLRDTLLQQNAVTRVLVHLFEVHAVAFLLAIVSFSQWLSVHSRGKLVVFVTSAVASFFLFIILSAFACICFIAHHSTAVSDDVEQASGASTGLNGSALSAPSAAAAAAAIAPPLMCDMKVTLERVSEHFYRIGAPLEKATAGSTLSGDLEARKDTLRPEEQLTEERVGHTTDTEQSTRADTQTGQQHAGGNKTLSASTIEAHGEGTEAAAATSSAPDALSVPADAELCMICCNTKATAVLMYCGHGGLCFKCAKTCFNRTGLCPACRRPVKGVLEVQRPSGEIQQSEHLEGVIRHVSR